ncbi:response regulator transcription factor [Microbacterium sp. ASV49]|uniref:Response regulator transcription factor n=1 Tax=Microbacterium candidum TaxID=3041922 RepID=A0ABT7MVI1_9MICO|nr:response regulator transcription factor [Microbacterium sp. ASV49]MDL9978451.1 response regulator transcription factor [Microbacterium sp. ASV49]
MSEALPALLYVEDDADIAEMTIEALSDAYRIDHVADGEVALQWALRNRYDVMVVDRRLPGRDGASLVEAIRTARITTPILMLTALGNVPDRVEGLDAGANDYLTKPFDFDELLARLRALRRGFQAEGRRREVGEWIFVPDSQAVHSPSGLRVTLTATENALLELLSASPERVFSREEIMQVVFTTADGVGAVDTYVHYIRRKTTPEMIETVRGRGYRLGMPS